MSIESTQDTLPTSGAASETSGANVGANEGSKELSGGDLAAGKASVVTDPLAAKADVNTIVPPTYTPNYKYKAALQDKELDEFWHPLVKDPDSEKKVKDIFTRADAFDYMKEKLIKRDSENESLRGDYEAISKDVTRVVAARDKGDLDSVFRNLELTDEAVIRWAANKVDYMQMLKGLPPDQRTAIERQQQAQLQNSDYEEQLSQMRSEMQTHAVQARTMQLDMSLSRPEVTQAAQFWDGKMGYQGAFRDLVIEEAQKAWTFNQKDLSAEQAVAQVLQKFGKFIDLQGSAAPAGVNSSSTQAPVQVSADKKPVIPSISGTSKTPIRKQIKSVDDINKLIQERENDSQVSL